MNYLSRLKAFCLIYERCISKHRPYRNRNAGGISENQLLQSEGDSGRPGESFTPGSLKRVLLITE